jgi:hypothetical protein
MSIDAWQHAMSPTAAVVRGNPVTTMNAMNKVGLR